MNPSLFFFTLLVVVTIMISIASAAMATTTTPATRYAVALKGARNTIQGILFDNKEEYLKMCEGALADNFLLANASFAPTGNTTGWNTFHVTGNQQIFKNEALKTSAERLANRGNSDADWVYRAVGYLETFLAPQETIDSFSNAFWMPTPKVIDQFMDANRNFIENTLCNPWTSPSLPENATAYGKSKTDNEYIVQICKLYSQIKGLAEGMDAIIQFQPSMKPWNLPKDGFGIKKVWMLNVMSSFMDYFVACNVTMMFNNDNGDESDVYSSNLLKSKKYFKSSANSYHPNHQQEKYLLNQHCSALIKVTDDDVQMWHASWAQFNNLIRKYAVYELETSLQYSSLAVGFISSGDDYYINNDHQLMVTETTFQQGNQNLTKKYVTPWTVPEFMRGVVASQLAKTGQEWSELFLGPLNDGTYCNSWMILTKGLVERNETTKKISNLQDGALWLVEAMPGNYSVAQDITHILRSNKYFASYNIPYAPQLQKLAGSYALYKRYGNYFSFNMTARAEIFRRDQDKVVDITSGAALMRSNRFKTDPFSVIPGCIEAGCNPMYNPTLDVAARGDLAPPNQTFGTLDKYYSGFFGPAAFAAIDVKGSSIFNMMKVSSNNDKKSGFIVTAQSGPTTFDGNPPLVIPNLAKDLQMNLYGTYQGAWNFPFQNFDPLTFDIILKNDADNKGKIFAGLKKRD